MTTLFDAKGRPIEFARPQKALVGEIESSWGGNATNAAWAELPRRLNLTFDTTKLDIPDYRVMREHPQIASSLAVLSFMMYQRKWRVVGGTAKVRKHCEENLQRIWPRVIRAMSTAFWAGFSPCALQWENDIGSNRLWITKIKDLQPEDCVVRWKEVPSVVEKKPGMPRERKIKVFDGIKQRAYGHEIPVTNSFWYTFNKEHGNFYGTKVLNAAFQPWYFSLLMHLYANRYFERFAEPTPVGRAPFGDTIRIGDQDVQGNRMMQAVIQRIRSGNGAVLPNDRTQDGFQGDSTYDYTIEFLESQLRGVDYERYLLRLDDEMSMALFTPLLMMRQSDTGSSNLGVVHTNTFHTMLNAISGDWEEYINRYLLRPMKEQNFGLAQESPQIKFIELGRMDNETMRMLLQTLIGGGKAKITDLEELGLMSGLTLQEIKEVLPEPNPDPAADDDQTPLNPDGSKKDPRVGRPGKDKAPTGTDKVKNVVAGMARRVTEQALRASANGTWNRSFDPDLGYRRQFVETLGIGEWEGEAAYARLQDALSNAADVLPVEEFTAMVTGQIEGVMQESMRSELANTE